MANAKFVKTAAAVALGASVVTTAVAPGAASAATSYKIKDGKLYKNGKIAKGYVVYKGTLYKNGKKNKGYEKVGNGSSMKLYYNTTLKQVFKTATNATLLFKDGVLYKGYKQAGSNERLYKDGKLTTGWVVYTNDEGTKYLYNKGYLYTGLKTATRSGVKNLFENGVLAEGEKAYKDELYVDGVLAEGVKEFDGVTYIDGKKDVAKPEITAEDQTIEYGAKDVDVLSFAKVEDNSKEEIKAEAKISFDGKDVEKIDTKVPGVYTVTYTAKDKNGNEAEAKVIKVTVAEAKEAKVESVTAISAKQLVVTFNKEVDASTVADATTKALKNITVTKVGQTASTGLTAKLSEDKKSVTITAGNSEVFNGSYAVEVTENVKTTTGDKFAAYTQLLQVSDKVAPSFLSASAVAKTSTKEVTVKFDEPVKADGVIAYVNGTAATVQAGENANELKVISSTDLAAGSLVSIKLTNVQDYNSNYTASNPLEFTTTVVADTVAPAIVSTTVEGENKVKVTFDKDLDPAQVLTSKTRLVAINGSTTQNPTKVEIDGKTATFTFEPAYDEKTGLATGIFFLDAGVKDTLGNESTTSFNKQVSFSKDAIKPTVASVEYKDNAIVAKFSEKVQFVGGTVTAINKATGKVIEITLNSTNAKLSEDEQTLTITDGLAEGTYELRLPAGLVNDKAGVPNASEYYATIINVTATTVTPEEDTEKPVVTFTENNGTLDVTTKPKEYQFGFKLTDNAGIDFASVLNTSNYTYDGKALPTGSYVTTDAEDSKDKDITVTVHVPKTSIVKTVDKGVFSVVGVKDAAGNTINGVQSAKVTLADGVAPELTSAVLNADNSITVAVSEKITSALTKDVIVTADGAEVTGTFTEGTSSDFGKYVFTATTPEGKTAIKDAKKLTVKTAVETTTTDEAGNKLMANKEITVK